MGWQWMTEIGNLEGQRMANIKKEEIARAFGSNLAFTLKPSS